MEISPLSKVSMTEITRGFNRGFSDYILSIHATESYLSHRWKMSGVDYGLSVGMLQNSKLVGMVVIAIGQWNDHPAAYNAATCVDPDFRRQGITSKLFNWVIPQLRDRSIRQCRLEVITNNAPALAAYGRLGFMKNRHLACFRAADQMPPPQINLQLEKEPLTGWDPAWLAACRRHHPAWEYQWEILARGDHRYQGYTIRYQDQALGFALVDTIEKNVVDFGLGDRDELIPPFFQTLSQEVGFFRLHNIDTAAGSLLTALETAGLQRYIDQHELYLPL